MTKIIEVRQNKKMKGGFGKYKPIK